MPKSHRALALGAFVLGAITAAAPILAHEKCAEGLEPTTSVPPALPSILHNEFEGTARVEFLIDDDGGVSGAVVKQATWKPIGNARGMPEGYVEAIVQAVTQWRYPAGIGPCIASTDIEIQSSE